MFNSNVSRKMIDRMFRRINGVAWDLMSGKLGIQDTNGIYTLEEAKDGDNVSYSVSVNPFENFSVPVPAFATQVPLNKVKPGDLVVTDKGINGWVTKVNGGSLNVIDKNGTNKNITPVTLKVSIGGNDGVLVVQNLFNITGSDGAAALQGSLLPLLMMGDGAVDLESVLPMLLFAQGTGGANAMTSMLPMLIALGGGKANGSAIDKLLPLMMMSGFGNGNNGGMNPMMMLAMTGGLGELGLGSKQPVLPANANAIGAAPALEPISARRR